MNKLFITVTLVVVFVSCNSDNRLQEKPNQTPKALEKESSLSSMVSKRGSGDLIESLYNELLDKNTELKKLENNINEVKASRNDSTQIFNDFNWKNESYFNATHAHLGGIKDSLLKNKMRNVIADNLKKYSLSIAKHNDLMKIIESKNLKINDLHEVLKITKTLPLIEKYQQNNFPNTKALEGYIKRQDETLKNVDKVMKE